MDSSDITITVVSCLAVNSILQPGTMPSNLISWPIDGNTPLSHFDAFSVTYAECPITAIEIYADMSGAGASPPNGLSPGSVTSLPGPFDVSVINALITTPATYDFYVKVIA